jgi:hypothetical protein
MSALLLAAAALAGPVELETTGEARVELTETPDIQVDADGTKSGQGTVLDTRLRVGAAADFGEWTVRTEWDLLSGQIAGDTWQIDDRYDERDRGEHRALTTDGIVPRELAVEGRMGSFQVAAGLQTSHWGLGLLANDGAHDNYFGRSDFGDRVLRVRATTAPFKRTPADGAATLPRLPADRAPVLLTVAVDSVVADDLARWSEGQGAYQAIAALQWLGPQRRSLGVYGVGRWQLEGDGRQTRVGVIDLYADWPAPIGDSGWTARAAAELAGVVGHTTRASSYQGRDGLVVQAGIAALQSSVHAPDDLFVARLHAGWSSGDRDPDDEVTADLGFDRDYDVGMVLFDEWRGAIEAGTSALLTDPQYAGKPPDGVDAVTTEGAFRRASYLQPMLETSPTPWVTLRVGAVVAFANTLESQPFYSARAGGEPRNHLDEPVQAGLALGSELDWSIRAGPPADIGWAVRPEVRVQGGHAMLSERVVGSGERRVDVIMGAVFLRWEAGR